MKINKYTKTRKLKGNTNMKIETIEKYLLAFKNGTSTEVKDKPVCGLRFCYGNDDYFKVGRSFANDNNFKSDLKVRLSKSDGTITYFEDDYEVTIPVDAVFSVSAYYDERKIDAENSVEIV